MAGRREMAGRSPVIGKRLSPKAREIFLEGLKRYQERGVRILLDGKEVDVSGLEVIFEEREDGSFYMGDYILEDEDETALREQQECCGILELHENRSLYQTRGACGASETDADRKNGVKCLKEIRFDRVYNW